MAVVTRQQMRACTPPDRKPSSEYDTIKRNRFYDAWDNRQHGESLRHVSGRVGLPPSTCSDWLRQRIELGRDAHRRTRRVARKHLGRPFKLSTATIEMLVGPQNPVRGLPLHRQIAYHNLNVTTSTLQRALKRWSNEKVL